MVAGFHRSFSLPGSPRPKTRPASEKSYHVRSISLPCRSHPLISQLEDEIRSVQTWTQTRPESESGSAAWICDGLNRLDLLHSSLSDLLNLPENQDSLRCGSNWSDRILDDFLRLADAHGIFRSEIVNLSSILSESQITIRRRDSAKIPSCIRSSRKIEKQLIKLASSIRDISKPQISSRFASKSVEEVELAGIMREVVSATVSVSVVVFLEAAAVAGATSAAVASVMSDGKTNGWMGMRRAASASRLVTRDDVMERLEGLEEWIGDVEAGSVRLFRCLVNSRVALLNILTW